MTIYHNGHGLEWVLGRTGTRYTILPLTHGTTPCQAIDAHLAVLVRDRTAPEDIDVLLDARLVYELAEAVGA